MILMPVGCDDGSHVMALSGDCADIIDDGLGNLGGLPAYSRPILRVTRGQDPLG